MGIQYGLDLFARLLRVNFLEHGFERLLFSGAERRADILRRFNQALNLSRERLPFDIFDNG